MLRSAHPRMLDHSCLGNIKPLGCRICSHVCCSTGQRMEIQQPKFMLNAWLF